MGTNEPSSVYAILGVDSDADERTLRRAYAQKLKAINQATEIERFQTLRRAYELALDLSAAVRHSQPDHEATINALGDDSVDEQVVDDFGAPRETAVLQDAPQTAWERSDRLARTVLGEFFEGSPLESSDEAQDRIQTSLERTELLDVDARLIFEWGIASVLAQGWRPGHQHLFSAAMNVFGWRERRETLRPLGRAGAVVNDAIEGLEIYDAQPWKSLAAQRDLIREWRLNKRPSNRRLMQFAPLMERVASVYPAWLHVITNTDNIDQWRRWHAEIPRWQTWIRPRPYSVSLEAPNKRWVGRSLGWFAGVFFVLVFLGALINNQKETPAYSTRPASGGDNFQSADFSSSRLGPPLTAPIYPQEARRAGQQGKVVVRIVVGADGKAMSADVERSSGYTSLDNAALNFAYRKKFDLPKSQGGLSASEVVRLPVNFVLEENVNQSYGDRVRYAVVSQIHYTDAPVGNPRAEVIVSLAPDGLITSRRISQASGVPKWDQAVMDALGRVGRMPLDQDGKVPSSMVLVFKPKP